MSWPIVITLAAVGLAAVAAILWLLWWRFPKRQVDRLRLSVRDPKARADIEDNLRKTIGQLIGGTMVLIGVGSGAVIAYMQLSQQQRASHELLISNQVGKGFEQLGSTKVVVRLGGIYALEGVMNTSEQYHQAVLEALSAFVREGTRTLTGDGPPATDVKAALTVIGRRAPIGTGTPNLAGAHIPKVELSNANFSGANLSDAELGDAYLIGTNLIGAVLIDANLGGANLSDADLGGANLRGANLRGADLRGAYLRGANLSGANLSGANLSDANLGGASISQRTLDLACGTNLKLDPGLTIKPCP